MDNFIICVNRPTGNVRNISSMSAIYKQDRDFRKHCGIIDSLYISYYYYRIILDRMTEWRV